MPTVFYNLYYWSTYWQYRCIDKKEDTKNNNLFSQLAWWTTDEKELRREAEQYNSLGITKSTRGIASLLILALIVLNIIFVLFNWVTIEILYVSVLYLLLALFTYKGNRFVIMSVMALWTIDRAISLYSAGISHTGAIAYIMILLWWAFYMKVFYGALRVENLRREIHPISLEKLDIKPPDISKNNKKPNNISKIIYYSVISCSLLLIVLSVVYYFVIFLPQKENQQLLFLKQQFEYQKEKDAAAKKDEQLKELRDTIKENQNKTQDNFNRARAECVAIADKNYKSFSEAIENCQTELCVKNMSANEDLHYFGEAFIESCAQNRL